MRASDEDAPFSESMLEWLEEGDRIGQAPSNGVARPSGAHHTFESPRRYGRYVVGGGVLVASALVLVLRLMGGKAKHEEPAPEAYVAMGMPAVGHAPAAAPPTAAQRSPDQPAAPAVAAAADQEQPSPAAAPAPAPAGEAPGAQVPAAQALAAQAAPAAAEAPAPVAAAAAAAPAPEAVVPPAVVVDHEPRHPLLPPTPAPPVAKAEAVAAPEAPVGAADYDTAMAECRAQMNAGRIQHAVTSCRQAADARPKSSEALTLLAEAEFTRGHTGVALKLATQAATANQNFADAYVIIGGVYQEKGKNAEARAAYEQYLALQPKGKHAADLRAILGSL